MESKSRIASASISKINELAKMKMDCIPNIYLIQKEPNFDKDINFHLKRIDDSIIEKPHFDNSKSSFLLKTARNQIFSNSTIKIGKFESKSKDNKIGNYFSKPVSVAPNVLKKNITPEIPILRINLSSKVNSQTTHVNQATKLRPLTSNLADLKNAMLQNYSKLKLDESNKESFLRRPSSCFYSKEILNFGYQEKKLMENKKNIQNLQTNCVDKNQLIKVSNFKHFLSENNYFSSYKHIIAIDLPININFEDVTQELPLAGSRLLSLKPKQKPKFVRQRF